MPIILKIIQNITHVTYGYQQFSIDVTPRLIKHLVDQPMISLKLNDTWAGFDSNLYLADASIRVIKNLTITFQDKSSYIIPSGQEIVFDIHQDLQITIPKGRTYIYFHVCQINNWIEVTQRLYDLIVNSQLIDYIDELCFGVLGTDILKLLEICPHPKVRIIFISDRFNLYEKPTLQCLQLRAQSEDCQILYLHAKGVSKPGREEIYAWVRYLAYFTIEEWRKCIVMLKNYGTCGTEWLKNHYRGNFWWANSSYLRTLPTEIGNNYTDPEFWIGKGDTSKVFNCFNTRLYPNINIIPDSMYRTIPTDASK